MKTPETLRDEIRKEEGTIGVSIWEFLANQESNKKAGKGGTVEHRLDDLARIIHNPSMKPNAWKDELANKLIRMAKKGWARITPTMTITATV